MSESKPKRLFTIKCGSSGSFMSFMAFIAGTWFEFFCVVGCIFGLWHLGYVAGRTSQERLPDAQFAAATCLKLVDQDLLNQGRITPQIFTNIEDLCQFTLTNRKPAVDYLFH